MKTLPPYQNKACWKLTFQTENKIILDTEESDWIMFSMHGVFLFPSGYYSDDEGSISLLFDRATIIT